MASTIEVISKVFLLTLFRRNSELYIKDDIVVYFVEV